MLYQKVLTGVFVGADFQQLTCRFILLATACKHGQLGLYLKLHNLTSQEHRNSPDWCFGLK